MVILIAVGGLVVLFVLLDLADYLLTRAGKRTVLHRRARQDWHIQAHHSSGRGPRNSFRSPPGRGGSADQHLFAERAIASGLGVWCQGSFGETAAKEVAKPL